MRPESFRAPGSERGAPAAQNGRVPTKPYLDLSRAEWSALRARTPLPLTAAEVEDLRGLGDVIDLDEVRDIYLPLSRLLNLHVAATHGLRGAVNTFLGEGAAQRGGTPFVIGVAGSVAVGKSTVARLLQALLARWPGHPRVELVTTDGFLLPKAELERRGLMSRKGFPESYDRRALTRFVADVKAGKRRGERAGLLAPDLRHRARRAADRTPARHPDRRGPQRPPARPARQGRPHPLGARRLLRLLACTWTRAPATSSAGTSSASASCARRPSRTRARTSTGTRRSPRRRPWSTPARTWRTINEPNLAAEHRPHPRPGDAAAAQGGRPQGPAPLACASSDPAAASRAPEAQSGPATGSGRGRRAGVAAPRAGPAPVGTPAPQPSALLTTSARRAGDRPRLLDVGGLHHHPDQRLGAGGAQQHPAGLAQFALRVGDRGGQLGGGRRPATCPRPAR